MKLDPILVLHLVNSLLLNDFMHTINPYITNISKFSTLLIITKDLLQQGTSQPQGVTFKGDILACSPLLHRRSQGLWAVCYLWSRMIDL